MFGHKSTPCEEELLKKIGLHTSLALFQELPLC